MSTDNETKINRLLQQIPTGTVILASWLKEQGISYDLQQRYKKGKWFESIGTGALKRTNEVIDIYGALYAMQFQAQKAIHIGGRSSLAFQGFAHYVEMQQNETVLFASKGLKLPSWFLRYNWNKQPIVIHSGLLPSDQGLIKYSLKSFNIIISDPARAIMECLDMAPERFDLTEAYQIMEGLNSLIPAHVQKLLEQCSSVKVKRLFLYFAEKSGHVWVRHLDMDKVYLGSGKRSLVKNGVLIPKYKITVPVSLT